MKILGQVWRIRKRTAISDTRKNSIVLGRRLAIESLESRRMLAVFPVSNIDDSGPGSLRDAIAMANAANGPDEIVFNAGVTGTIALTSGELEVTDGLTINGPGQQLLTIDAQRNSRVLHYSNISGDLTLRHITFQNGYSDGQGNHYSDDSADGGGVRFVSSGTLTLDNATVTQSEARFAEGGGIFFKNNGTAVLTHSTVSENKATEGYGAGVFSDLGSIVLTNSAVIDNRSEGYGVGGGGIFVWEGDVTLTDSQLSGNTAQGSLAKGGGITVSNSSSTVHIERSVVSGNKASSSGGGIRANRSAVTAIDSTFAGNISYSGSGGGIDADIATISGSTFFDNRSTGGGAISAASATVMNSTITGNRGVSNFNYGSSGGLSVGDNLTLVNSTITGNMTEGAAGGLSFAGVGSSPQAIIINSIIAGNSDDGTAPDFQAPTSNDAQIRIEYSLIGSNPGSGLAESAVPDGNGNLIGGTGTSIIDPMLGPLGNNGGQTETHDLLPGSPAIDSGDPSFNADGLDGQPGTNDDLPFDQRGSNRFVGTIDMGAVEADSTSANPDFDGDGDVDGADFLRWQRGFGTTNAIAADGDSDGDGDVDDADLSAWEAAIEPTINLANGDFDSDNDVDGADFLAWQRGVGAHYDSTDLSEWEMGFGQTSTLRDEPSGGSKLTAGNRDTTILQLGPIALGSINSEAKELSQAYIVQELRFETVVTSTVLSGDATTPVSDIHKFVFGEFENDSSDGKPWLTDKLLEDLLG